MYVYTPAMTKTFFCLSLRVGNGTTDVLGSFVEITPEFDVVTPLTHVGPFFSVEGTESTLDQIIGALPASALVVTISGAIWFHKIGACALRMYPSIVDFEATFVARQRYFIQSKSLHAAEGCDPKCANTIVAILRTVAQKGRLTWKKQSGGTGVFWVPNFYLPISQLRVKHPAAWVTVPQEPQLESSLF